jgi:tryptophanyl-tRNA synthetase
MSKPIRFLTGITTSGTPHLGNYVGSIRPAVRASMQATSESFYFLADYHALIKTGDPERVQRSTLEIAASWLAAGLQPEKVVFYRQSDIPEIPELMWFLTCVTGKGALNRAHAYKAMVDKNTAASLDADHEVSAGLFMYPVLMGADILLFHADKVPVGRDQIQHIEMARDMASSFNHRYGNYFVMPQAEIEASVATLPGLDGRKMSKSYDNTIPLFAPREQLKKLIASMVTDSCAPGEPKKTEGSALFEIYQAFASEQETLALRQAYAEGIGWGDAKELLFARIDQEIAPMRQTYQHLLAHPEQVEAHLLEGARKARAVATPLMRSLREAVGIRRLKLAQPISTPALPLPAPASFKQYREADGLFYFKLLSAKGQLLLQSKGFAAPKEAGQTIAFLRKSGWVGVQQMRAQLQPFDDALLADIEEALNSMQS